MQTIVLRSKTVKVKRPANDRCRRERDVSSRSNGCLKLDLEADAHASAGFRPSSGGERKFSNLALFYHLVGPLQQRLRHREPKRLGGFQING